MRLARALAVALIAAMAASPAHADFKRSYAKGLDAANEGKWDEVEARMKEALAEEGTPQAKVKLYGMRFEAYVPQYYLGLAAYKRGDCTTALRYWDNAAVSAVVSGESGLSGTAQSGMRDCKVKLAGTTTPTQPVATTTPSTGGESTPPKPPVSNPPPTVTPPPKETPATTEVAATRPPITTTPPPPPPPPPKPPPTTVTPPATVDAPSELVSALDNFLAGRYTQAANVDPNRLGESKARYHALLVRAASRHLLSQLQGEAGAALLSQAQSDVRAAKTLQPTATPDATVFSPRFRQFYSVTR